VVLIAGAVIGQGAELATSVVPSIQNAINDPGFIDRQLAKIPFYEKLAPFRGQFETGLGEVVLAGSSTAVNLLQSATRVTVSAVITALLVFYSFFFFLMDGDRMIKRILYYLPLDNENETLLLNRFRSVTIATLKGTAVIGLLQGTLAGIALYVCGISNALFWGVAMVLLSVVPGIGTALVWIPAVIYLITQGQWVYAAGLGIFCAVLVGSIDNVLRPKLVGSDTQLHELMIFFSTLGGLITFGFPGFIIGPIIAALFVTVWEIYGVEFRDWLPQTDFVTYNERQEIKAAALQRDLDDPITPDNPSADHNLQDPDSSNSA